MIRLSFLKKVRNITASNKNRTENGSHALFHVIHYKGYVAKVCFENRIRLF
jgi:hypothetical protein